MNTTTANKPKRELPAFMELILEDGAENTPWGDLYWRMFGRPDGSLGDEINQEALDNWDEIIACKITYLLHAPRSLLTSIIQRITDRLI